MDKSLEKKNGADLPKSIEDQLFIKSFARLKGILSSTKITMIWRA